MARTPERGKLLGGYRGLRSGWVRGVVGVLIVLLSFALYLSANPALLRTLLLALPIPGMVEVPIFGPTPTSPEIAAERGNIPDGYLALNGASAAGPFGCGFLLELADGRRVGVSAAHATQPLSPQKPAEFHFPGGGLAAALTGQIGIGRTFIQERFDMDYALWGILANPAAPLLEPDPRGRAQPGERIWVLGLGGSGSGTSLRWPGTVMSSSAQAAWLRMDDSFDPRGYSGCPVVSQYTGRLVGMAVAGEQRAATVIGLHPVGSLVEKAQAALNK